MQDRRDAKFQGAKSMSDDSGCGIYGDYARRIIYSGFKNRSADDA